MNQQTINEAIRKEEQTNIYLSEVVQSLQEKLLKSKPTNKAEPIMLAAEIQLAQIKTINKKIQIYSQQLQKIKDVKTTAIVQELADFKAEISQKEAELSQLKQDVDYVEAQVKRLRKISHDRIMNRDIKQQYVDKNYELQLLKKKLQRLEIHQNAQLTKIPQKTRNTRSLSQTIKVVDPSLKVEEKKSKIDQYALYKNLTKFYTQEEQKLIQEIQQLEAKREQQRQLSQKLKEQIAQCQQKIESLPKPKLGTINRLSSVNNSHTIQKQPYC